MKEKVNAFFEKISPFFGRLGSNLYLQTISASMMATLGPVLLGSLAVLLMVFPLKAVPEFLEAAGMMPILNTVNTFTIGSIAIYVAFLMAKNLVTKFDPSDDGVSAGIISLMSFFIVTPLAQTTDEVTALPTTWLSAQGVFSAMLIGLFVGRVYVFIQQKGWKIKMPDSVPPMVTKVFDALVPTLLIGFLFILITRGFAATSFGNMHQFIYSIIQEPLKGVGGTIGAMVALSILQQVLWFFGIHGTNVIMPLVTPLWMAMDVENLNAVLAGQTPPNIVGLAFFNIITWSGMAFGLVLLMFFSKSKQYKELGKLALVPALFGITEPLIFGFPLVLNFDLAIPFIFNNSIALLLSYFLTQLGIVARFMGTQAVFGLPLGFHAAVQGSVSIIILQIVLQAVLSPILWYPWFKRIEKKAVKNEQAA